MRLELSSLNDRAFLRPAVMLMVLALGVLVSPTSGGEAKPGADDGRGILRYDPIADELVPIPKEELKVGCVYSHFSPRRNRRVWSYVQPNGEFWYAFGEGTTQQGQRLDVRASEEARMGKLQQLAPGLAYDIRRGTRLAYVRLSQQGKWELAETATCESIYNAENGDRWESIHGKYVPVRSTHGYRWAVKAGKYVPAEGARRGECCSN